ncbi:cyclodeaminase/cyclohydrolase family protein [Micromonospora sp. DT81.3]|uniref:cyclodeaminase/cyclohydrolase family protein n=1 Tax=Actinomycetes TaxID=1760 RepID=UPI003CEB54DA
MNSNGGDADPKAPQTNVPDADVPVSIPLSSWLDKLAQPRGAPGGGAACGVLAAISAALLHMVAEYTRDSPDAGACADRVAALRVRALEAAEADGVVSAELGAALRPSDDPGRDDRVRQAAVAGADSSVALGRIAAELVDELALLFEIGNTSLRADLEVAGEALSAALGSARVNVRANVRSVEAHRDERDRLDEWLVRVTDAADQLHAANRRTRELTGADPRR